jgi:K+-sensing histidine kinase KdpD
MTESSKPGPTEIQVSMPEVVKFVRQLAHDLRNHLNAAELQSAYLMEIAENNELREEIKRLRGMIAQVGGNLQDLTTALSQPRLTEMPYAARDFVEDLQQKLATDYPKEADAVNWDAAAVGDATLNIDPQYLLPALLELFANAFRHERAVGALSAAARVEDGRFTFTLSEPKQNFQRPTENWGHEPLRSLGQGHYGLGLHRTRAIVEAHGGEFSARHDQATSSLVTTVTFPLAAPDA